MESVDVEQGLSGEWRVEQGLSGECGGGAGIEWRVWRWSRD